MTLSASDLLAIGIAAAVWLLIWKLRYAPTLDEIRRREERPRAFHVRDRRRPWKRGLERAIATFLELAPDRHSAVFHLLPPFAVLFLLARLTGCF